MYIKKKKMTEKDNVDFLKEKNTKHKFLRENYTYI